MHFTAAEIGSWVGAYMWPFIRIAALVGAAPIFGTRTVPVRIRVGFAVVLAAVIAPIIPPVPAIDPLSGPGLHVVVQQVLIGVTMGFALQLVFHTLIFAGQIIGQQMGLGFASMMDPQNGITVPVISQVYTVFGTLLFLALDGHLAIIQLLADSFHLLPVGATLPFERLWDVVMWGSWVFKGALLVALPATVALLIVNLAFGVVTRAAPQFNIFAVGFPVTLLLGFAVMILTLPNLIPELQRLAGEAFFTIYGVLGRGG